MTEVVSLAEHRAGTVQRKFSSLLERAFAEKDAVEAKLREVMLALDFPPSYVEAAAADLADGWINSDEAPLWHSPDWRPPEGGTTG